MTVKARVDTPYFKKGQFLTGIKRKGYFEVRNSEVTMWMSPKKFFKMFRPYDYFANMYTRNRKEKKDA